MKDISFQLNSAKRINGAPVPNLDYKYGIYKSINEALEKIPLISRNIGMTVGISIDGKSIKEYWWKDGINNEDLIVKNDYNNTEEQLQNLETRINNIPIISISIIQQLPNIGEEHVLYLIPSDIVEQNNRYDKYIWLNDTQSYESLGKLTSVEAATIVNNFQFDNNFELTQSGNNTIVSLNSENSLNKNNLKLEIDSGQAVNIIDKTEVGGAGDIESIRINKPVVITNNNDEKYHVAEIYKNDVVLHGEKNTIAGHNSINNKDTSKITLFGNAYLNNEDNIISMQSYDASGVLRDYINFETSGGIVIKGGRELLLNGSYINFSGSNAVFSNHTILINNSTVNFTGSLNMSGNSKITGSVDINGKLTVTGSLFVDGDINLSSGSLNVNTLNSSNCNCNKISAGNLSYENDELSFGSKITIEGTNYNNLADNIKLSGNYLNIYANNDINITGDITCNSENINISGSRITYTGLTGSIYSNLYVSGSKFDVSGNDINIIGSNQVNLSGNDTVLRGVNEITLSGSTVEIYGSNCEMTISNRTTYSGSDVYIRSLNKLSGVVNNLVLLGTGSYILSGSYTQLGGSDAFVKVSGSIIESYGSNISTKAESISTIAASGHVLVPISQLRFYTGSIIENCEKYYKLDIANMIEEDNPNYQP